MINAGSAHYTWAFLIVERGLVSRYIESALPWLAVLVALLLFGWNNLHIHARINPGPPWLAAQASNPVGEPILGFINPNKLTPNLWTLDDAFISMRYAENWATGKGPVYNEGEYVEGYTTFLWVAVLAAGHALGFDLPMVAKVMGFVFYLATLLLLANAHRFIDRAPPMVSAFATILYGGSGIVTGWVMSGMEVPMVGFWICMAVLCHLRSRSLPGNLWWIAVTAFACAMATMSRPECGLVFLILFADRLLESGLRRDMDFFYFGLIFSAIYLPYFAWRVWYYGHLLPNTFYVKVGANLDLQLARGLTYAEKFVRGSLLLVGTTLVSFFVAGAYRDRFTRAGVLGVIVTLHFAYVLYVGGDVMPASRFFSPFLTIYAVLAALLLGGWIRNPLRAVIVAGLIVGWGQYHYFNATDQLQRMRNGNVGRNGELVGTWMRENFPPGTVVALNTAGSTPFFSKLPTIDMLGLNDEHIAHRKMPNMGRGQPGHEKGDGKYVLSRRPDYIQLGSSFGAEHPRSFKGDQEIFRLPGFKKNYEFKRYPIGNGKTIQIYKHKDAPPPKNAGQNQNRQLKPVPAAARQLDKPDESS